MSEFRDRMTEDLRLAGLVDGTARLYLRAVHQLAGYYMTSPDQLRERQVQQYLLYVRDELGMARGTFEPILLRELLEETTDGQSRSFIFLTFLGETSFMT